MPIDIEAARWGMRLILGVEPRNEEEVRFHAAGHASLSAFRQSFFQTPEARNEFDKANEQTSAYKVPAFLMRPSEYANVCSRFQPPTLSSPVSQLCTAEQMRSDTYLQVSPYVGIHDQTFHRKLWEYVYIFNVVRLAGMLGTDFRGIGFGTGIEPLPSAFAKLGTKITATDAPADIPQAVEWAAGQQWTQTLEDIWFPELVDHATFMENVTFQTADMTAIPTNLRGYDFCWSACCLEHLGSIENGLKFIRESLATLRPGGLAVHTTEFNLQSNEKTLDEPPTCLFRKRDLERLASTLIDEGHTVEPLNFWPGADPVDEHIDVPPYSLPHIKLKVAEYSTTSFGMIVRKSKG